MCDSHIEGMLDLCDRDDVLRIFAAELVDQYQTRGKKILAGDDTSAAKHRALHTSREQLRTALCDLIQPMLLRDTDTSPATTPTVITTPKQES